ncbi:TPA: TIGR02391 family protein [Streptococcus suis]|nr:TIGR02391 family protein [Streptococcus suis]
MNIHFLEALTTQLSETLSHREITQMFTDLQLPKIDTGNRQVRLYNSVISISNITHSDYSWKTITEYIAQKRMYSLNRIEWEEFKTSLNKILVFEGLELNDSGKLQQTERATTYTEASERFNKLYQKLELLDIHRETLKYCQEELLEENYFHAVFEASKGLFHKIRTMTGSSLDSARLIDQCFNIKNPVVIINGNKLQTLDEQSDYKGFYNLLFTIAHLYRNSKAHKLKHYNPDNINDAITAFTMLSLAFKFLDNCSNVRRLD